MRVKIGDTWYNSDDQPICIQVSEFEQRQICSLDRSVATQGKYAIYSDGQGTADEILKWMAEE